MDVDRDTICKFGIGEQDMATCRMIYVHFPGYYITKNAYSGNFDAQVDFELLNWPTANGVRVGLALGAWQTVERDSVVYAGDGRDAETISSRSTA